MKVTFAVDFRAAKSLEKEVKSVMLQRNCGGN